MVREYVWLENKISMQMETYAIPIFFPENKIQYKSLQNSKGDREGMAIEIEGGPWKWVSGKHSEQNISRREGSNVSKYENKTVTRGLRADHWLLPPEGYEWPWKNTIGDMIEMKS